MCISFYTNYDNELLRGILRRLEQYKRITVPHNNSDFWNQCPRKNISLCSIKNKTSAFSKRYQK